MRIAALVICNEPLGTHVIGYDRRKGATLQGVAAVLIEKKKGMMGWKDACARDDVSLRAQGESRAVFEIAHHHRCSSPYSVFAIL